MPLAKNISWTLYVNIDPQPGQGLWQAAYALYQRPNSLIYGIPTDVFIDKQRRRLYATEADKITLVDYATGASPVVCDAVYFLHGTTATLDGKHVIMYRHDGNYNAKVIQLPAPGSTTKSTGPKSWLCLK